MNKMIEIKEERANTRRRKLKQWNQIITNIMCGYIIIYMTQQTECYVTECIGWVIKPWICLYAAYNSKAQRFICLLACSCWLTWRTEVRFFFRCETRSNYVAGAVAHSHRGSFTLSRVFNANFFFYSHLKCNFYACYFILLNNSLLPSFFSTPHSCHWLLFDAFVLLHRFKVSSSFYLDSISIL